MLRAGLGILDSGERPLSLVHYDADLLTDVGSLGLTWTNPGSVVTQTVSSKFGAGAASRTASLGNGLLASSGNPIPYDTGACTVDFWLSVSSQAGSNYFVIRNNNSSNINYGLYIYYLNTTNMRWGFRTQSGIYAFVSTLSPSLGWHHLAVEWYSGRVYGYLDGVLQNAGGTAYAGTVGTLANFNVAGSGAAAVTSATCVVDEFAIWGTSRYKGVGFTPPTAPY